MLSTTFSVVLVLVTSTTLPQTSALDDTNFHHLDEISPIPEDLYPDCSTWVDLGECHLYYEYMFEHCTESCVTGEDLGTIGYFLEEKEKLDDNEEEDDCVNVQDSDLYISTTCEELAHWGECHLNRRYMRENCAKSCLYCLPTDVKTFEIGVGQKIMKKHRYEEEHIKETLKVIAATNDYMSTEVMENDVFASIRRSCYNEGEYCASMAALGFCERFESNEYYYFMMTNCAPACQTCEILELITLCTPDEDDNVFKIDDLDMMFRRIVGEDAPVEDTTLPEYVPVIHSRPAHQPVSSEDHNNPILGPWVVTLDNFLSDEECDHLIEIGYTNENKEGFEEYDSYDTSLNSLCESGCYNDPVVKSINQRMSAITGIPECNSEYLQMLKYVAGRTYDREYSRDSYETMPGPTVVTVFLFLNDVRKGGEIRFDSLAGNSDTSLVIQPKKGTALIWPGVQNDPSHWDWRTSQYSLPVTRGVKYGVQASFHLRSYDHDNCDYKKFHEVKWS